MTISRKDFLKLAGLASGTSVVGGSLSSRSANSGRDDKWYVIPEHVETRWSSFENITAEKGGGGKENLGAKGHPFDTIPAGESKTLLQVEGAGIINRIWLTITDRTPVMLRSLRLDMYWDGAREPAVSAPLGDFFGTGLGRRMPFECELFSDPEGRSFNSTIPMPFRTEARVTLTNESDQELRMLFFDVNFQKLDRPDDSALYFHGFWNRTLETESGENYEILPKIEGKGRFLGANFGVITNPLYENTWFGEGEVKIYLDGDRDYATLVGTGAEDYIGTAWGQGTYANRYQGSLIADRANGLYTFYRYHIPDPVFFHKDIRATIHRMGGAQKERVKKLLENGAILTPVTAHKEGTFIKLLETNASLDVFAEEFPDGWINFYRLDDWSSMAYFYLDRPTNDLPPLQPVERRVENLDRVKALD